MKVINIHDKKARILLSVPTDIKKEFETLLLKENYAKVIPVIVILYAIEWIVYMGSEKLYSTGDIVICFQIFNTIMIPGLYVVNKNLEKVPRIISKGLLNVFAMGVLLFGLALVMGVQNQIDLIHMFMMCAVGVAAFIIMTPFESFIIYFYSMDTGH